MSASTLHSGAPLRRVVTIVREVVKVLPELVGQVLDNPTESPEKGDTETKRADEQPNKE